MDEPSLEALSQRVKRLEQASLRWKRLASLALVSLGIAMLRGATASKKAKSPADLRAQRIVLVEQQLERQKTGGLLKRTIVEIWLWAATEQVYKKQ